MMHLRKSYEVTGYVVNECVILCPNCFEEFKKDQQTELYNEDYNGIFLDSEFDYQPCCEWCFEEIDCNVINEDINNV